MITFISITFNVFLYLYVLYLHYNLYMLPFKSLKINIGPFAFIYSFICSPLPLHASLYLISNFLCFPLPYFNLYMYPIVFICFTLSRQTSKSGFCRLLADTSPVRHSGKTRPTRLYIPTLSPPEQVTEWEKSRGKNVLRPDAKFSAAVLRYGRHLDNWSGNQLGNQLGESVREPADNTTEHVNQVSVRRRKVLWLGLYAETIGKRKKRLLLVHEVVVVAVVVII